MSFERCITTFKQPFIDIVYGCSDVESALRRRRNECENVANVGTKSCFDVVSTFPLRLYCDVIPTSEFDVGTTPLCLLGIRRC